MHNIALAGCFFCRHGEIEYDSRVYVPIKKFCNYSLHL